MKKGLVGCLAVGLLLIVVCGGAAYWFVVRPLWNAGSALATNGKDLVAAAQVQETITNKAPYTPPADGKLTPAQVQSLVSVLTAMQSAMGADADALKAKYEAIEAEQKAKGETAKLSDAMGAYSDFSAYVLKASKAQAAALNQLNMSLDEYHWIRGQAVAAIPFMEMDEATLAAFSGVPAAGATSAMPAEATLAESASESSTPPEEAAKSEEESQPDAAANAQDKATADMANAAAQMATAAADMAKAAAKAQQAVNDSPEIQAAKANALLLKPYKDLIEKTASSTWMGL